MNDWSLCDYSKRHNLDKQFKLRISQYSRIILGINFYDEPKQILMSMEVLNSKTLLRYSIYLIQNMI